MRPSLITVIIGILISVVSSPVTPQSPAPVTVVVSVDHADTEDASLPRIVAGAVEVSLARRGLHTLKTAAGEPGDFVLKAIVQQANGVAHIALELSSADSGHVISAGRIRHPLSLTLDRPITALAARILDEAQPALLRAAQRRDLESAAAAAGEPELRAGATAAVPAATPAARVAAPPALSAAGAGTAPGATGVLVGAADSRPAVTAILPEPPLEQPGTDSPHSTTAPRDRPGLVVTSAAVSVVPVHRSARYMSVGYGGSVSLALTPLVSRFLGIGVSVGAIAGRITGSASSADLLLAPLSVSLILGDKSAPVAPSLRLEGGAAIMRASSTTAGTHVKLVPHGGIDIAVRAAIAGALEAQLSVGFEGYAEGSILILGFSPTLGLSLSF